MSRQFVCDWCGARFSDSDAVAHVDVTLGASLEQDLHMCVKCSPDFLNPKFPDDPMPIEAGGEWGGSSA